MQNHTPVHDVAQRARATSQDVQALGPLWQNMMRRDDDGWLWVSKDREYFLLGALEAEADCRREQRIEDADAELVASHRDLMNASRRSAPGLQGAARHQKRLLERVTRVLDALTELVDAKADGRRMKPETAAQIRTEVDEIRRDAQENAERALEAIRSLLGLAA